MRWRMEERILSCCPRPAGEEHHILNLGTLSGQTGMGVPGVFPLHWVFCLPFDSANPLMHYCWENRSRLSRYKHRADESAIDLLNTFIVAMATSIVGVISFLA
jgi:hypothetical protein